jgi:hypothetical protein
LKQNTQLQEVAPAAPCLRRWHRASHSRRNSGARRLKCADKASDGGH